LPAAAKAEDGVRMSSQMPVYIAAKAPKASSFFDETQTNPIYEVINFSGSVLRCNVADLRIKR